MIEDKYWANHLEKNYHYFHITTTFTLRLLSHIFIEVVREASMIEHSFTWVFVTLVSLSLTDACCEKALGFDTALVARSFFDSYI